MSGLNWSQRRGHIADISLFHSFKDGLAKLERVLKLKISPVGTRISMHIHQHSIKMLESQISQTCVVLMNVSSLLGKGLSRVQGTMPINRFEYKR
jgi:hypothetical protein